jgi:Predicted flavin-nucleotide-binding protein
MYHANREIRDMELLKAILDMCDVINIGLFDEEYPYVLPVNFGYEFKDDLIFYTHHAIEGYKNDLIRKNPKVCVTTHRFVDKPNKAGKLVHDFRSIMAFGEITFISRESGEYRTAWEKFASAYGREVPDIVFKPDYPVLMCKIVCPRAQVIGKAQYPIKKLEDIPFPESD